MIDKKENHFLQVFKFKRNEIAYHLDRLQYVFEKLENDYRNLGVTYLQQIIMAYKSFESITKLHLNETYEFKEFEEDKISVQFIILNMDELEKF